MLRVPQLIIPPRPFDPARAARVKEALTEQGFVSAEPLLDSVFGNSAFLGRLALRETGALGEYFAAGPETVVSAAILLAHACAHAESGDLAGRIKCSKTTKMMAAKNRSNSSRTAKRVWYSSSGPAGGSGVLASS